MIPFALAAFVAVTSGSSACCNNDDARPYAENQRGQSDDHQYAQPGREAAPTGKGGYVREAAPKPMTLDEEVPNPPPASPVDEDAATGLPGKNAQKDDAASEPPHGGAYAEEAQEPAELKAQTAKEKPEEKARAAEVQESAKEESAKPSLTMEELEEPQELDELVQPETGLLKEGDKGPAVKKAQQALEKHGFAIDGADGVYGPKTAAAVRKFQEKMGLDVDGIIGPKTLKALQKPPKE